MRQGHKGYLPGERTGMIYIKRATVETSTEGRGKGAGVSGMRAFSHFMLYTYVLLQKKNVFLFDL